MSDQKHLTLAVLLLNIRSRLLEAREKQDRELLLELRTALTLLREASYESEDTKAITVLVALEDAARDGLQGVPWKSDIPSKDEMIATCS